MYLLRQLLILILAFDTCYLCAQKIGTLENARLKGIKAENGLIISWQWMSSDLKAPQVEVFDEEGHPLARAQVLRCVPDAGRVSISDVSARPGFIAVAAVYRKAGTKHLRPVPTLLVFDFKGQLSSAFSLVPSREIHRIEVDQAFNVWTMTTHADNKDPSSVPMVVEYTSEGKVAKQLLARSEFPFHAQEIVYDHSIGPVFMGYDAAGLWFWLPGSTELVAIPADGSGSTIVKTGLPERVGHESGVLISMTRNGSGRIVAQLRDIGKNRAVEISYHTWSADTGWSQLKLSDCDGGLMIGGSENRLLYLQYQKGPPDREDICTSR